jgi:hypothetical protein
LLKGSVRGVYRRASLPSEAKSLAKKRAGRRAWSPIAANAIVECATMPLTQWRERALFAGGKVMAAL